MMFRVAAATLSGLVMLIGMPAKAQLPPGFVDLTEVAPSVVVDLRYATDDNFVGQPVDGYDGSRCVTTSEVAAALSRVQKELARFHLGLKVFDAYRPQRAVDHFVRWSQDASDQRTKEAYYPNLDKRDLISKGYIAARSSHSRGSAVDLTIVSFANGQAGDELDMGTAFDFFGRESWVDSPKVTAQQRANRMYSGR